MKIWSTLILLIASGFLVKCIDDVPHGNPIDPDGKNQGLIISGTVTTLYPPVSAIPNAVLTILPENNKSFSNSLGTFEISGLVPGDYTLLCTADGYDQDTISIKLQSNLEINFTLDGLPFFEIISLTTHHEIHTFAAEDLFFLEIETKVNDLDGIADINRVLFQIPELNVIDTLSPSLEVSIFNRRFSIDDFPVNTIQTLIGREFILSVTDDAAVTINSEKQFLTRVIDETPVLTEPVSFQTIITDSIQFQWEKIRAPFWFEHTIEIFQINQSLLLKIDEIKNIANSETFLSIINMLPMGDYIWILKISDEFGNTSTSSSIEGRFHVN